MKIEILGTGCPNCKKLEENAKKALEESEKNAEIIKVTSIPEIMSYGIMSTPAIVVDDEVKAYGKVSTVEEIKKMIN
ncbi:MAG: thioredoxin family protein [Nanoarchaeota archaeon]|nr:thioredoxin family protein [Nanoarchaeota archaeon]